MSHEQDAGARTEEDKGAELHLRDAGDAHSSAVSRGRADPVGTLDTAASLAALQFV